MFRIVGLDESLTGFGCCAIDQDGKLLSGAVFGYGLKKDASELEHVQRLLFVAQKVVSFIARQREHGVEVKVVIERPGYNAGSKKGEKFVAGRQHDLGQVSGVVKAQMFLATGIVISEQVPVSHARKVVFGNGKIKKTKIVSTIDERFGIKFDDGNVADAFVVAECFRRDSAGVGRAIPLKLEN